MTNKSHSNKKPVRCRTCCSSGYFQTKKYWLINNLFLNACYQWELSLKKIITELNIFRSPVDTNTLTHTVTFCWSLCELVHLHRRVICRCQPVVSLCPERPWSFEGGWRWMGGTAGANPPVPRAMCPAPSQLHHAAFSVVSPLERYKAPWMLSAQTTQCPPSRDYSSLNGAARRRIQSKRYRKRRRRYTILQQELHSLKGRGHRQ